MIMVVGEVGLMVKVVVFCYLFYIIVKVNLIVFSIGLFSCVMVDDVLVEFDFNVGML